MPTKTTSRNGDRRGISRIDQEQTRTHGYFVRFGYERTPSGSWRPRHKAFFGDASYGGKRKALEAAEAWLMKAQRADKRQQKAGPVKAAGQVKAKPKTATKAAAKVASRRTTRATRTTAKTATRTAAKRRVRA